MADLVPEEAIDAAWIAAASVRDASSRLPNDADTGEVVVAAALTAAAPLIVAAELDARAEALDQQALALPRDGSAAPGMVVILQDIADDLRGRASVLRGEGDPK